MSGAFFNHLFHISLIICLLLFFRQWEKSQGRLGMRLPSCRVRPCHFMNLSILRSAVLKIKVRWITFKALLWSLFLQVKSVINKRIPLRKKDQVLLNVSIILNLLDLAIIGKPAFSTSQVEFKQFLALNLSWISEKIEPGRWHMDIQISYSLHQTYYVGVFH